MYTIGVPCFLRRTVFFFLIWGISVEQSIKSSAHWSLCHPLRNSSATFLMKINKDNPLLPPERAMKEALYRFRTCPPALQNSSSDFIASCTNSKQIEAQCSDITSSRWVVEYCLNPCKTKIQDGLPGGTWTSVALRLYCGLGTIRSWLYCTCPEGSETILLQDHIHCAVQVA